MISETIKNDIVKFLVIAIIVSFSLTWNDGEAGLRRLRRFTGIKVSISCIIEKHNFKVSSIECV